MKRVSDSLQAAFSGINPFPTVDDLAGWAAIRLSLMDGGPGIYAIASDLQGNELVLLRAKDCRRQIAEGADLEVLGHAIVMTNAHASILSRINSSQPFSIQD
jgi:hypothetical protein